MMTHSSTFWSSVYSITPTISDWWNGNTMPHIPECYEVDLVCRNYMGKESLTHVIGNWPVIGNLPLEVANLVYMNPYWAAGGTVLFATGVYGYKHGWFSWKHEQRPPQQQPQNEQEQKRLKDEQEQKRLNDEKKQQGKERKEQVAQQKLLDEQEAQRLQKEKEEQEEQEEQQRLQKEQEEKEERRRQREIKKQQKSEKQSRDVLMDPDHPTIQKLQELQDVLNGGGTEHRVRFEEDNNKDKDETKPPITSALDQKESRT